jgi:hypothetical protein
MNGLGANARQAREPRGCVAPFRRNTGRGMLFCSGRGLTTALLLSCACGTLARGSRTPPTSSELPDSSPCKTLTWVGRRVASSLRLAIAVDSKPAGPNDPIIVDIRLSNVAEEHVVVGNRLDLETGVRLTIRSQSGEELEYRCDEAQEESPRPGFFVPLWARQYLGIARDIRPCYQWRGAGKYSITATFQDRSACALAASVATRPSDFPTNSFLLYAGKYDPAFLLLDERSIDWPHYWVGRLESNTVSFALKD